MSPEIQLILQFIVGLTFLGSAFGKVLAPALFFDSLRDFKLLPSSSVNHVGMLLIVVEGVIAFAYLSGSLLQPAGILALVLLFCFLLVTSLALKRGLHIKCSCFGAGDTEPLSASTIVRIVVLAGVVLILLARSSELDGWLATAYSGQQILLALTCAVLAQMLASWLLAIPDLVQLIRGCRGCARRTAETDA